MARARNIKPSFFQNEDLAELTPITRLAFIGMWTIADFKGCIEFRPKRLKVQLMPYDDCDFEVIANDLDKSGLIAIYSVSGQRYIKITSFEKHQNPHKNERESGSDIPDYAPEASIHAGSQTIQINPDKDGIAPADSLLLNPYSLIPVSPITPPPAAEYSPEFELAWNGYPERPGANKKNAYKAWNARLKAGVDFTQMTLGVDRYAYYVSVMKVEPQFIKQPETFFGPSEHYLSDWKPVAASSGGKNSVESLDEINARNNAEAKRLLFGTPSEVRTINA